uniref:1-acylglycerol-3-phosphate O-acyltransferase Pnpla3 (Trinotate prediction) n=1 Tax=Myxobolus squamalis TaxID=59785 RepID=A0A6B2G070_MYXSQ
MLEIALGVVYVIKSKKLGIFDPFLRISQLIKKYLENNLPENIHELCTDRLFINLTEFPSRKPFLVSKYHCKSDLIDAIVCTTFIPIIFGFIPPIFRGKVSL